ncbi:(2Fe-2S) ferredoxin domain-containing protein [Beggiatoa leptomitoformis]|uniref:(2Fe-2S) ferredoxin domain-containing protein n=1 Tax=Beggiatoa leptomitoformis TaxID=288004 RepID=A0A2N9YGK0_9GAMM|nr:(2Fe-2S) ferredoxin domain-containing protein [Beggiatoa leptomitoformis]ALG68082.1 (2Fe-2S) ferredoxin domain-containing protein [Beggiatoa leptomitoformis]AUI69624.1 (2Fe-2S) ferredoxin domain-containing protein [Beggiatoa leptomitoformis]
MPRPQKHVFVCAQSRPAGHPRGSCTERGCKPVIDEFFRQWQARNLFTTVSIAQSSCLGPCHLGTSVVVYPEGVMYGNVTIDDVSEIFEKHLIGDEVVERLVAPADAW